MKENKVNVKLILNDSEKICEANIGDNLLDIIRKNNIDFDTPCNGNGSCGKCRCKIKENTDDEDFETADDKNNWVAVADHTAEGIEGSPVHIPISKVCKSVKISFLNKPGAAKPSVWELLFY